MKLINFMEIFFGYFPFSKSNFYGKYSMKIFREIDL